MKSDFVVFGVLIIAVLSFVSGVFIGFNMISCDEEQAFYNGSCFMYGAIDEMLTCHNNISVFIDENNWNVSCINDTLNKLGEYEEISYCPWYRWEDFKPKKEARKS